MPSTHWHFVDDTMHCEGVSLLTLARDFGTPLYVYSKATIIEAYRAYTQALSDAPHLICYAVKANSNIAILQLLARLGSGFDIVSGGELKRVLHAGGNPKKITFSGVAKTEEEIAMALQADILSFNIESEAELLRIERVAQQLKRIAPISVRLNPDVDAHTHPYISTGLKNNKFGVDDATALSLYRYAHQSTWLTVTGIDSHIGSQITELAPYLDACDKILELAEKLHHEGIFLHHIDFGGGVGVRYRNETPLDIPTLTRALREKLIARGLGNLTMVFEPGRSMVANAGILLTTVQYIKKTPAKNFLVVDAGMNDMIRPALYEAWMPIFPILKKDGLSQTYDVVGPVCESSDCLGRDRALTLTEGDILAVAVAGAYGASMANTYNARPKVAEVLVDGQTVHLIAKRQQIEQTWALEALLPGS